MSKLASARKKGSFSWAALLLAGSGIWLSRQQAPSYARLHPDLRALPLRFRSPSLTPPLLKLVKALPARAALPTEVEVLNLPGFPDAPAVRAYLYKPPATSEKSAALLYIHGGGFIVGSAAQDHATCAEVAKELGIVVLNVDYRLAPETPFPGPLEDCYAALAWLHAQSGHFGIDPARIAVGGQSAGAGLAAALAQMAHDRGRVQPAFQWLLYPMLDDRTVLQYRHEGRGEFVWTPASNMTGWTSYLGRTPTLDAAPDYAVPARRETLRGLAPAWIGVGTLDLFYPEDRDYARRLAEAGVPCEFDEVAGAYHAFESLQPKARVSRAFRSRSLDALRRGLRLDKRS